MRLHDLTRSLAAGMAVYPGDPEVVVTPHLTLARDGCRVSSVTLGSHAGTHLDAPAHFLAGGATVENLPLEGLLGPARVLSPAEVGEVAAGERILLKTGWDRHWRAPDYFTRFPSLPQGLAERLARAPAALVGLDTPGLHPDHSEDARLHRLLLGAGVVIVENLVGLDRLPARVVLIALPLPLAGADGAPCRVVGLEETGDLS